MQALEAPNLTFALEPASQALFEEMMPLLEANHDETEWAKDITLNPDWDAYLRLEVAGLLRVFTARVDEQLVGYAVFTVSSGIHHKQCLQAVHDIMFIAREHRGTGLRLIRFADAELEAEGTQIIFHSVKVSHDYSPVLKRLGYEHVETIWARRVSHGS